MNKLIINELKDKKEWYKTLVLVILLLGAAFRLFHYLYNRSLWMDEVYLTPSLIRMNYYSLATRLLDYQQKAPITFLWLVKFFVNIFGNSEKVFRFVPFISGLISLVLFAKICSHFLKPQAKILALCIFSFSPALIYHSVEIKQYATECLATLLAVLFYIKYQHSEQVKNKIFWGLLGASIIWLSFSVIFMLMGIAIGLSIHSLFKKNWDSFFRNLIPFSIWALSFLVNYLLFTHKHAESTWVVYWFKTYDNFMPFPPVTLQQLKWFPRNFLQMMDYPLGLTWNLKDYSAIKLLAIPIIPIVLLFTGIVSIFRKDKKTFSILIFPVLLMLLASGIYLYPLVERFWVFIAPVFILFIAMGYEYYQDKINLPHIHSIIILLVITGPLVQSVYFVIKPGKFYKHKKSYVRESFLYINNNFQNGDAVYNYWNNAPGYCTYRKVCHLKYHAIVGKDYRKSSTNLEEYNRNLNNDFNKFSGSKRVWLIFNTQFLTNIGDKVDDPKWYYKNSISPNENLVQQFKKRGEILKKFVYSDVTLYLLEVNPG